MSEDTKLGKCCACGKADAAHNIIMLHYKGALPGRGWGCLVCKLPADGIVSVVCDHCWNKLQGIKGPIEPHLKFGCRGYPGIDGRIPIEEVLKNPPHDHDLKFHQDERPTN